MAAAGFSHRLRDCTVKNRSVCAIALTLLAGLVGCGQDVYESRLAVTSDYFEHVNTLNANLSTTAQGLGAISIRPPAQFVRMLDDEETEGIDESQPYYFDDLDEIPGLVAAYQADVTVDVEGQDELRPAFIYVATNEEFIKSVGDETIEIDPLEYHTEIENRLSSTFGVYLEPGKFGDGSEPNVRYNEKLPRPVAQGDIQYEQPKNYEVVRFAPEEPLTGFDVPMQYAMYKLMDTPGDLQPVIFIVAPEQARPDENLQNRFRMMLETLVARAVAKATNPVTSDGSPGLAF